MTGPLLTVEQAAELSACCEKTIRRAIDRGDLVAVDVGDPGATNRTWRVRRTDLETWWEMRSTPSRRRDSGRAQDIAPIVAAARSRGRHGRTHGLLAVEPGMGRS